MISVKTGFILLQYYLCQYNLRQYCNISRPIVVKHIKEALLLEFKNDCLIQINCKHGPSDIGGNKLTTYCTFKHEYGAEGAKVFYLIL